MTTDRMLQASLDEEEVCACEDPFGESGYEDGCPAHAVHLLIEARLDCGNPYAEVLRSMAQMHLRHPAPGPVPSASGSCGACGGTGEVFRGWAIEGGPIFEGECGCETPYCGGCGEGWPCMEMRLIAEAVGVKIEEDR